ncbi:uncharacterized protein LOC131177098 [Hevea brasiliensis]|uniref:uncharacterized protein LOC131177098 n=1 Tax=Hevea brasiliensis TaxID=3981 RepID=UPI0025F2C099|nr:uncharacterized protein LOC131177098 [Hevea brasiliensis]
MTRKAVKGNVIADLLTENPIQDYEALDFEFLDEYVNEVNSDDKEPNDAWEMFILVAIDYFSKWVEVMSYAYIMKNTFLKFFKNNVICRHGLPSEIVTDNAKNLNGPKIRSLCDQYKIWHLNSSPYHPQMNIAVEAANKNLKRIIRKMTVTYKD